jgi:hypothetical protein
MKKCAMLVFLAACLMSMYLLMAVIATEHDAANVNKHFIFFACGSLMETHIA